MNNFVLDIWFDEGSKCTLYSVKNGLPEVEEGGHVVKADFLADAFFERYTEEGNPFRDQALQLFRLVTESIANRYGATDDFFDRVENRAYALPPKPKQRVEEIRALGRSFPLRLYAYRVSVQIVILFDGGVKEGATHQDSPSLESKFRQVQTMAKRIDECLRSGMIEVSHGGRYLRSFDGSLEISL